jgi:glycerol-3-phosphate dehydrogenase (NAD(P)+)
VNNFSELKVGIIGAGSWGTTLALHLHRKGCRIVLWEKFPEKSERIAKERENREFLPGYPIPNDLMVTSDAGDLPLDLGLVVFAVPSQAVRSVSREIGHRFRDGTTIVSVVKGIEFGTFKRMSEVLGEELEGLPVVALSGPSHAEEVVIQLPTSVVAASRDEEKAIFVQNVFMDTRFRVYTNSDIVGVELGGALKNIIAIANGICSGLNYGDNTMGALMARGIAEISRLGVAMGAEPSTFAGLSGVGDLITTCISAHSRNRMVGLKLAMGKGLEEILKEMVMVAEGVETTRAAKKLAEVHGVDMPITNEVYEVLFEGKEPRTAVDDLMLRDPKPE